MEKVKSFYYSRYESNPEIQSVIFIANDGMSELLDGFDRMFLVITENKQPTNFISHYIKEGLRIQERWVHKEGLERWILHGDNRNIIQWVLQGEIVMDKDHYLHTVKQKLLDFPPELREKRVLIEFSQFLRRFMQSKEYLEKGQLLDAHSHILGALSHWAHMVIIQGGSNPEMMVWNQVRQINPGVYKLYEEIIFSSESLEQRVRLALLAVDFSVLTKMKLWCQSLIRILESREQPWSASEIKEHPAMVELKVEVGHILRKLAERSIIKEVAVAVDEDLSLLEMRYRVND